MPVRQILSFKIMGQNFSTYTFTNSVKEAQSHYGSRESYQKIENRPDMFEITPREKSLIESIDGFYMATVGENGWPYVQFRGGPKGFLKIIDKSTIGYADFRGNMQYISTGNINSSRKTSLILMNYRERKRLKIWAEAKIIDAHENPELQQILVDPGYKAVVERLVTFNIKAFDWNCPQHITPRYTVEEIKEDLIPQHPEIKDEFCR